METHATAGSPTLLIVAILALVIGFAALTLAFLRRHPGPGAGDRAGAERADHGGAGALVAVVIVATIASGWSFYQYFAQVAAEGREARYATFDSFSALPRVDRIASKAVNTAISNVDKTDLNTTTWLSVSVTPRPSFFRTLGRTREHAETYLKMTVTAPAFDVAPVLDTVQRLPQDTDTFAWMLTAKTAGDQNVHLRGVVFRVAKEGRIIDRETIVNQMRGITVKAPLGADVLMPVVTALIGLLGTSGIGLLVQLVQRRSPASERASQSPHLTT